MGSSQLRSRKIAHDLKRSSYHGFPKGFRLNAVTDKRVITQSSAGLSETFCLESGFISSAKEAENGSGLLAVADNHVILLHDTERKPQMPHRLGNVEGSMRCLTFDKTSKKLFYSSSVSHSIHCYSIDTMRDQSLGLEHRSQPTIIAISPGQNSKTGACYMLSISNEPTDVHITNIANNFMVASVAPSINNAAITAANFHPRNADLFLLAFSDGSLSVHSVSSIMQRQDAGYDGRIKTFLHLHKMQSSATRQHSQKPRRVRSGQPSNDILDGSAIISAAFLGGYPLRTVSIGMDGMCRIADFEFGSRLVISWFTFQNPTALAVLHWPGVPEVDDRAEDRARLHSAVGVRFVADQQHSIAIGSSNGKVAIFDSIGLMHQETVVDPERRAIKDLSWLATRPKHAQIQCKKGLSAGNGTQFQTDALRSVSPRPEIDKDVQGIASRPYPPARLIDSLRARQQQQGISISKAAKRVRRKSRRVSSCFARAGRGSDTASKVRAIEDPSKHSETQTRAIYEAGIIADKGDEYVKRQHRKQTVTPRKEIQQIRDHEHKLNSKRILVEPESPIDPDWPVYRLRGRRMDIPGLHENELQRVREVSPALPVDVDFDTLQKETTKEATWDGDDEPTIKVPELYEKESAQSPAAADNQLARGTLVPEKHASKQTGNQHDKCQAQCEDHKHLCPCSLGIVGDLTHLRHEVEKLRTELAITPAGSQGWIKVGKFMLKRVEGAENASQIKRRKQPRSKSASKSKYNDGSSDTITPSYVSARG